MTSDPLWNQRQRGEGCTAVGTQGLAQGFFRQGQPVCVPRGVQRLQGTEGHVQRIRQSPLHLTTAHPGAYQCPPSLEERQGRALLVRGPHGPKAEPRLRRMTLSMRQGWEWRWVGYNEHLCPRAPNVHGDLPAHASVAGITADCGCPASCGPYSGCAEGHPSYGHGNIP